MSDRYGLWSVEGQAAWWDENGPRVRAVVEERGCTAVEAVAIVVAENEAEAEGANR